MKKIKSVIFVFALAMFLHSTASAQSRFYVGVYGSAGWNVFGVGASAISSKGLSLDVKLLNFLYLETGFVQKALVGDDLKSTYHYSSVPIVFKLKPNFVNLAVGTSVDAMTKVIAEKPNSTIGGAGIGIIARLSKDININERWVFEPSVGLDVVYPADGGISLGVKLKYNL